MINQEVFLAPTSHLKSIIFPKEKQTKNTKIHPTELARHNIGKAVSSHFQEQTPRYRAFSITRLTNNCKVDCTGQACGMAGAFHHCLDPHITAPGRALCYNVSKFQRPVSTLTALLPRGPNPSGHSNGGKSRTYPSGRLGHLQCHPDAGDLRHV